MYGLDSYGRRMGVFMSMRAGGIPGKEWIVDLAGEELYIGCTACPHGKAWDDPEEKYRDAAQRQAPSRRNEHHFQETLRRFNML